MCQRIYMRQSDKRQEWIRKRLKGIASSAPRLASSSAGRNECPGTHCGQREDRSATEFEIGRQNESQIVEEKRNGTLVGAAETSRMAQASAEKLKHTGPTKKERVATEKAVCKNAGAALAKRNRAVCPQYQIVRESRWARTAPWRGRGES